MKHFIFVGMTTVALLFTGCSSKQYFEPKNTYSASGASSSYGGSIVDLTRDGATLKSGQYIGKSGVTQINLGEDYRFVSESSQYVLASNTEGMLKIINKSNKETVRIVSMHIPIVAATINGDRIAYILNNNTFGIYEIQSNKKVAENRSEEALAVDTRAASPIFIDSLVVFPMLDGKLIIVNGSDVGDAKVVYVSAEDAFNNVIYLSRTGDTMVAATPHSLLTLGAEGKSDYSANIAEVAVSAGMIYLFTKEGDIIKFNAALEAQKTTKFKFAHFSLASASKGKVYALDQKGSLIVLSSDLNKHKIYDIGEVDESALISGNKLYKDGKVIDLLKLGYE